MFICCGNVKSPLCIDLKGVKGEGEQGKNEGLRSME